MHHPVNRRSGGHGVGEDALPLREDQVGRDAQRPALVAFANEGEKDLGLLSTPGAHKGDYVNSPTRGFSRMPKQR